ncbi:hypothetical protein [Cupriavidus sp. UYPR2.512]|uniref:hypothetical protein n=1 Tax=Cupriavidus sp. UYPR2.512 TaxID=1080187 RepID=UPI00036EE528|nr:hypothetical protein [Cupriavidus sp. UYPR2.512]UIF89410.1 hypothetical protein KAF44_29505 [Cupriavidus necator]
MLTKLMQGATVEDLTRFNAKYPGKRFYIALSDDDDLPQLLFVHDGDEVHNPLASSPPWVTVDPEMEYGIAREDAETIARINGC